MASPAPQAATEATEATEATPAQSEQAQEQDETNEQSELEVDNNDADSAFGSEAASETTSVSSSVFKGYIRNGRRYQTHSSTDYYQPTDEKQWESMSGGHLAMLIMDSLRANPLFRAPLSPKAQHILDVGTGPGEWAIDVADKFPNITVTGVDLYPPPHKWVAPNCIFEVDDVTRHWTWSHKFDLIHMRHLLGSMNGPEFEALYRRAYDNLVPGGWIEILEQDISMYSDDSSLPSDSVLIECATLTHRAAEKAGRPVDTYEKVLPRIEAAGFVNVQTQEYKMPMGAWPKHPTWKDAGRVNKDVYKRGIEGWCLFLFTKFGEPKPWTPEEVQVYLAKVRNELDKGYHIYQKARRVWAQKPYNTAAPKAQPQVEVENVKQASASPTSEAPSKKQKFADSDAAQAA